MHLRIERRGFVEWLTSDFLAWIAGAIALILAILVVWLALQFAAQPALAQIAVPQACVDLATKYGRVLPPVLGKFKAAQVKAELKSLSDDDPDVKRCRDAVARMDAKK